MSLVMELVQQDSGCYRSCTSVVSCCDETDDKVLDVRIGKVRTMSCDRTDDEDEGERKVSNDKLKAFFLLHAYKTYLM
jgi:hypothetical protein